MSAPWWTEADAAELDLLIAELVDGFYEHLDGCPTCRTGEARSCRALATAIEIVLDWRRGRMLRSRAVALRARQDVEEAEAA